LTWNAKHIENHKLINLYLDFLKTVGMLSDRLKLIDEIARLNQQNKEIQKLTVDKYQEDCMDYKLSQNSLIDG